ncbi:MAG: glycosyltransferase family 4 protein [Candidatus Dormibacter sp.]
MDSHDVVVAFGYLLRHYPVIPRRARYLAMDIFDPFVLENLHMHDDLGLSDRTRVHQHDLDVTLEQLERADFLFCASERQRDFWLGALMAANRVNPYTFAQDPTLRRLIEIVPFGLKDRPPRRSAPAIKGVVSGIDATDVVVLWGGGIWNWFDPLTAIRAVGKLKQERPAIKLFFMGVSHPNPEMPQMAMVGEAARLSDDLGLTDQQVFFNRGWIPYGERENYLCDADIGVSLAFKEIETQFSFRTRVLDYLWAGLPVVSTGGDTLTDAAAAVGAGVNVPEGDVDALAEALLQLARDPERRARMASMSSTLSRQFTWGRVAKPLVAYCETPYRAADAGKSGLIYPRIDGRRAGLAVSDPRQLPGVARRVAAVWRSEGFAGVTSRALRRLQRGRL